MKIPHTVRISDLPVLVKKIATIKREAAEKLHVIADFDSTMTQYWVEGKRGISSHGIFETCEFITEEVC